MATPKRTGLSGRIELIGAGKTEDRAPLVVHAITAEGKVAGSAKVTANGGFSIGAGVQEKAARVLIGAEGLDPTTEGERFIGYRVDEFAELLSGGTLQIAEDRWRHLYWEFQCVSGSVRRCFPWPYLLEELRAQTSIVAMASPEPMSQVGSVSARVALADLSYLDPSIWRPRSCARVCQGIVEVYRRTCCCSPPVVIDPGDFIEREWPIKWPPPPPPPPPEPPWDWLADADPVPVPPGPGPDPAPYAAMETVTTGGALDVRKLNAERDAIALRTLTGAELSRFLDLRPYLWCTCGTGTKVAQGIVADDGTFSICWAEFPTFSLARCHDEYAYKVKQPINGVTVTIYDGPAAGQWFGADETPTLTSYSRAAVSCIGDPDIPGADGAIVLLHEIGVTESWRLGTPAQDSPDSVLNPMANSGLLDPSTTDGPGVNRNLGGVLGLRYFFSSGMQALGARSYRVDLARADAAGNPTGAWTPVAVPTWTSWKYVSGTGFIRAQHSLGPDANGRYLIPYGTGAPLASMEEWDPDQFHAVLDTTQQANGRFLVRVQVFDGAGAQIKPNGATGSGTARPFIFGRWRLQAGPPDPVPYSALTHLLWWDNRAAVVAIDAIRLNGVPSSAVCQFLEGAAGALVSLDYRAYHPNPGPPLFLMGHSLTIRKGLNGPITTLVGNAFAEVGEPPGAAQISPAATLQVLLAGDPKCAFAAVLGAWVKTSNGSGRLDNLDRWITAAFAAELV